MKTTTQIGGAGAVRRCVSRAVVSAVALALPLLLILLSRGRLGSLPWTAMNGSGSYFSSDSPNAVQRADQGAEQSTEVVDPDFFNTYPGQEVDYSEGSCDLYRGEWVFDPSGPLYNNSCPVIPEMENCQANGRPDKGYEYWRWKPERCVLPRFDARKFLDLMRGKTIAFVGDSVARNQMESLLCILWQVEIPVNRGNRRWSRWIFRSTSTTIIRVWSSWLVHWSTKAVGFAPKGLYKVFLDVPDEKFMGILPSFDVLVLSSGHWFTRESAYILNNSVVGGQLWWPDQFGKMQMNNIAAFAASVETCLTTVMANKKFTGIVIVRSYSPDHYAGGAWNTRGSCGGNTKPSDEVVKNGFTYAVYEQLVASFRKVVMNSDGNGSRLKLMDITRPFALRADGHPGPYRNLGPNGMAQRGLDGRPQAQDCVHWCMPGPIDTWNEMLLETIRREFEGDRR